MKTFVLTALILSGCGTAFDGSWSATVSASDLNVESAIKFAGSASDRFSRVSRGGRLVLQTVITATYKVVRRGETANLEFVTTGIKATDAFGAAVPAVETECADEGNCRGFLVSVDGAEQCHCAVTSYAYTHAGDTLVMKGFAGTDVTFSRR